MLDGTRLALSARMSSTDPIVERPAALPGLRAGSPTASTEFDRFLADISARPQPESLSLRDWVDLAEAWKITRALRDCGGNRSAAARALGIGRRTLYAKMEKLRITPSWC